MKKLILLAVIALSATGASAQTKIGYINTEELISVMPEAEKADADLKDYQNALAQQGQDMGKEADEKADKYVKDSLTLNASMKEIRRKEVVEAYQKAQAWTQQTAQDMYNQKAQQLIAPIRQKAIKAIQDVAKEKGYTYVLDASTSVLLVQPTGDDLLPAVKTKLGIKDAPAAPATKPTGLKPTGN
jgi:outer membrane protein